MVGSVKVAALISLLAAHGTCFSVQPCLQARLLQPSSQGVVRTILGRLSAQQNGPFGGISKTISSLPIIGQVVRPVGVDVRAEEGGKPRTDIPGPPPLPSVGNTLDVLRIGGLHKAFQKYRADYGPVCKIQIGTNASSFILVADPDLTRQITMSDFQTFRNRNSPGGGDGGALSSINETAAKPDSTAPPPSLQNTIAASTNDSGSHASGPPPPIESDNPSSTERAAKAEDKKLVSRFEEQEADPLRPLGVGVVAATDDKWKAMRATQIAQFGNPRLMSEYGRIVTEETAALVARMHPYARAQYASAAHKPAVDIFRWVRCLTTEVICRIAFSKRLGLVSGEPSEGGRDYQALADALQKELQRFLGNAGRVGRYQPIFKSLQEATKGTPLSGLQLSVPGLSQLTIDSEVMDKYEKAFIAERKERVERGDGAGSDLLGKLMQTEVAGHGGGPLSDADVQANVREAFVAGSETTGAAIGITLHQISSNPRIEWLVRKELRQVLGDKAFPAYEDLDRLTYLKLCIRETLRLYPSAHIFGRKAEEETEVGGFVIPKGSNLLMSPYYLGRDPEQWGPDAHLYRPERHLPTDPLAATRSKFAWMPFGAGPRMCLGASLAMAEATVCVAGILQNYKITPLSKQFKFDYLITIELEEGVPVRLTPLRPPMPLPTQRGPDSLVVPDARAKSPVAAA